MPEDGESLMQAEQSAPLTQVTSLSPFSVSHQCFAPFPRPSIWMTVSDESHSDAIVVVDVQTCVPLRRIPRDTDSPTIQGLVFADGRVWAGRADGSVVLYDADSGNEIDTIQTPHTGGGVRALVAGPSPFLDGGEADPNSAPSTIVYLSGGGTGLISMWTPSGQHIKSISEARAEQLCLALGDGGQLLAAGGRDGVVRIYRTASGEQVCAVAAAARRTVTAVTIAGNSLWCGDSHGALRVFALVPAGTYGGPDPAMSMGGTAGRSIFSENTPSNGPLRAHAVAAMSDAHGDPVTALVAVHPHIWSASEDGTIAVWDAASRELVERTRAHDESVKSLVIVGKVVTTETWTAGADHSVRLWRHVARENTDAVNEGGDAWSLALLRQLRCVERDSAALADTAYVSNATVMKLEHQTVQLQARCDAAVAAAVARAEAAEAKVRSLHGLSEAAAQREHAERASAARIAELEREVASLRGSAAAATRLGDLRDAAARDALELSAQRDALTAELQPLRAAMASKNQQIERVRATLLRSLPASAVLRVTEGGREPHLENIADLCAREVECALRATGSSADAFARAAGAATAAATAEASAAVRQADAANLSKDIAVGSLRRDLDAANARVARLEADLAEAKRQHDAQLRNAVIRASADARDEVQRVMHSVGENNATLTRLRDRVSALETEKGTLQSALDAAHEQVSQLTHQSDALSAQLQSSAPHARRRGEGAGDQTGRLSTVGRHRLSAAAAGTLPPDARSAWESAARADKQLGELAQLLLRTERVGRASLLSHLNGMRDSLKGVGGALGAALPPAPPLQTAGKRAGKISTPPPAPAPPSAASQVQVAAPPPPAAQPIEPHAPVPPGDIMRMRPPGMSVLPAGHAEVAHVVVETEEECWRLYNALREGADFFDMARQYSLCLSKDQGGVLAPFTRACIQRTPW